VKVEATFVRSAARASDLPRDGLSEIALVGRSNVGKSSLINALVRRRVARTSGAPGKTRLANIYRVARGGSPPLYLVDLPGYGYARGDAGELRAVAAEYFGQGGQGGPGSQGSQGGLGSLGGKSRPGHPGQPGRSIAAVLLLDARHPGLESDLDAWRWLQKTVDSATIVATKIDKLARGQRIRAMGELESAFEHAVLPVSAVTGEGLEELWKLIDRLANSPNPNRRSSSNSRSLPRATAPRHPKN